MNKCLLTITVSALSLACSNFAVASPLDTSHIHTQHTLGLKPISSLADSFNLAAATFLPDAEDGFGFGSNNFNDNISSRDNCSGFALSSCPAHAKCSKCTFGNKYKITGCETDYKQSGNACIAKTCSEINAAYKAEVPANQVCAITKTSVRSCYSSCKNIDFSGYPLDSCPSGAVCTPHPDCGTTTTAKGNCSPLKQKVTGCTSSAQKPNDAATACIDKDDTCPATYYKSCDTGTQGNPQYTEKGTACYQCKPKSNCGNEYIYDENNCPSNQNFHCSTACENKYKDCHKTELPFLERLYLGDKHAAVYITHVDSQKSNSCPGIKMNINKFYDGYPTHNIPSVSNIFLAPDGTTTRISPCITADQDCYELIKKMRTSTQVSIDKDMYCGNLILTNEVKSTEKQHKTTLQGNGHTLIFEGNTGYTVQGPPSAPDKLIVENLIIDSRGRDYYYTEIKMGCVNPTITRSVVAGNVTFNNVTIKTEKPIARLDEGAVVFYGTNYYMSDNPNLELGKENITFYGSLNKI